MCKIDKSCMRGALTLMACLVMAACATPSRVGAPTPHYKVGAPYEIDGRRYVPREDPTYDRTGVASWYGRQFQGKPTANGEIFDKAQLTAAHKTLPLPSIVQVDNLENGRSLVLRVNDRGPFVDDRIIDLSEAAARELGFQKAGLASVRVRYLGPASLPGEAGPSSRTARATSTTTKRRQRSRGSASLDIAPPRSPTGAPGRSSTTAPTTSTTTTTSSTESATASATVLAPSSSAGDPIATLIGSLEGAGRNLSLPDAGRADRGPASAAAIWLRVGSVENPNAEQAARLALADLGPARRVSGALIFGPYPDLVTAEAWRAAAIDAGYGDAGLVYAPY
ncbi:MAG: septal ring lytic transglycosylase RlpA family protein [Pseudomonadota bacterium]